MAVQGAIGPAGAGVAITDAKGNIVKGYSGFWA